MNIYLQLIHKRITLTSKIFETFNMAPNQKCFRNLLNLNLRRTDLPGFQNLAGLPVTQSINNKGKPGKIDYVTIYLKAFEIFPVWMNQLPKSFRKLKP